MKAVFISDAHLKRTSDENYKTISNFLDNLKGVDLLVILGDLFDFFSGYNKIARKQHTSILERLLRIKNSGTKIIYLEGNHDFFMGKFFTETLDAKVYPDDAEIMLDDKKIFMAHGDMVNKKDYGYRMLRWLLRSFLARVIFTITPSSVIWNIARYMSKGSRAYLAKDYEDDEILIDYAQDKWKREYDAVIIGHFHTPKILKNVVGNRERFFINTGDWITHFTYVIYENRGFKLNRFFVHEPVKQLTLKKEA